MFAGVKYKTWNQRNYPLFTVEGCSPKTNRAISSTVKYMEKMGPEKMFTIKRCSLIRGVHYEMFHCINAFRLNDVSHLIAILRQNV